MWLQLPKWQLTKKLKQRSHDMNRTRKNNQEQPISLHCPEEKIASLIAEAKTSFDDIFAALKSELVHYLLFSNRELLAGTRYRPKKDWENWGAQEGSVYVAGERLKVRKPRLRQNGLLSLMPKRPSHTISNKPLHLLWNPWVSNSKYICVKPSFLQRPLVGRRRK
jgi:hypothetical protein